MPEVVSSFKQFSFDDRITAALDQLSFKTPTPIQAQGIGPILEGRDILGLARTGTGKTAAFALPIIQDLLRYDDHSTRAVVIAPTRPLARQIGDMFEQLAQNTSLRTGVVYGGTSRCEQLDQIRHGVDVLVGTPGRLADFATSGQINLDQVRFLVIDEVDAILSQGYLEHVLSSVDCLPDRCRQTLMFSATLPEQVEHLVAKLTNQAVRIEIDLDRPLETIEHIAIIVPRSEKMGLLKNILAGIEGASLVFVSSRGGAEFVGRHLIEAGLRSAYLHAEMPQPNREWTVEVFRKGLIDTLVSTDLLGRGFDLPELAAVINYDLPFRDEDYVHRTGRTGRIGHSGRAITFVEPDRKGVFYRIRDYCGLNIELRCDAMAAPKLSPGDNGSSPIPQAVPERHEAAASSAVTGFEYQSIQQRLQYKFDDTALLQTALEGRDGAPDRQYDAIMIDWVGSAVTRLALTEIITRVSASWKRPQLLEELDQMNALEVAGSIGTGILFGNRVTDLRNPTLRAHGHRMHALLGAIYIDGGYEAASGAVMRTFANDFERIGLSILKPEATYGNFWAVRRELKQRVEDICGYIFEDRDLLDRALKNLGNPRQSYIGDARLGLRGHTLLELAVREGFRRLDGREPIDELRKREHGLLQLEAIFASAAGKQFSEVMQSVQPIEIGVAARLFKGVLGAIHSEGGIEAAFSVIGLFCPGLPYKPRRQLRTPDAPVRDTPIKVVSAPEPTQPPAIRSEPRSPPASLEPGPEHRLRDSAVASIAPAHLAPQTVAPSPAPSTSVSPPARAPGARPDVHSRPSRRGCRLQFEDSLDRIEHQLGYTFRIEALALKALGIVELPVVDSTSRSWLDALGGYALQFAAARIIAPKMSLEAPWREIAAHVAQVTGPESLHALSRDLGLAEHIVFEGLTQSLVQMERSIVSRTRALLGALFLDATDEEFEIVVSRRISSTFDGMALDSEGLAKLLEQPVDLNAAEQTDFEAALGHTFIEPRLLRAAFNCIPKLEGAAGSSNLEYIGRAALRLSAIDTLRKRGVTSEDDRGIEAKRLSGAEHLFETERGRLLQYVMVQNGRIKPVMQKQLLLSAVGAVCLDVGYAKTSELLRSLLQPAPAGTSQGLHITGSGSDPLRRAIISPAQIQTEAAARLRRATMAVARTFDPAILHELQPSDNAAVSSKMVACDPAGTRMPISEVWLGAPEFYSTTVERLFPDSTDTVTVDRGIAWALNQDYTQEALAKHGIEVSQLISHVLAGKLGRKPDSSRQQICLSDLAVYLRQCIAELSGDSAKTYELSALSARHLDLPPPYGAVLRIARNQLLESYRTNLSNLRKLIDASAPTVPELRRIGAGIIDKTELQELGIKLANNFASRIGAWAKRFMPQNALLKEGGYDQMALVNYFTYVDARLRQHLTHSNRIGYKQLHAEHLHFSGANSGDYKAFSVRAAADEASRHIACLCAVAVQEGSTDSATGHRRELIEQAQLSVTRYPDEALQAQLHLSIAALRAAGMKLSPNFNDFLTGYLEARGLAAVQSLSGEVLAPISVISRLFAHASQLVEGIPKGIRSAEQAAELNQNVPVAENTPASELSKKVLEELVHLNSTVAAALSDSGAALTRSCSAPSQQVVALSALREARFYLDDTGCDRFRKWLSVFGLEDALVQVESETWLSLGMLEAYTQYCLAVQPLLSGREPDPGSLLICFSGGLNGIVGTKAAIETELKSNQATLALARELGHLPVPGPLAATSDYRTLSKPWGGAQTILQSLSAEQRKQAPLYGAEQLSGLGLFAREDFGAFIERWCRRVSLPELPSSREGARLYSLPVLQAVFEGGSRFIESELGVGRRSLATCDELPFFVYHAGERPVRELRKKEMADQIRYNLAVVGELRTALGEIEACRNEEAYPYRSMNELRTAGWMLGTAGLRRFHAWADRLQLEPGFSLDDDNPRIPLRLVETYLNFCKRWALSELVSSHADLERQLVAFPPALDATKRVNTGEVYNFVLQQLYFVEYDLTYGKLPEPS